MSVSYKYTKATSDDLAQIVRRQTYKVWDYGDTIMYGMPGGKMTAYYFIERGEHNEVLEPAPIGWCPPAAPAYVYELEVGITKNPAVVIVGEFVRTSATAIAVAHVAAPAVAKKQQRPHPKNPTHTSQFKKPTRQVAIATAQQSIPLLVNNNNTSQSSKSAVQKRILPKIQPMSIPLSG